MGQAKWWGWGEEDVSFTHEDKPELAPFIERDLGLDVRRPARRAPSPSRTSRSRRPRCPADLRAALEDAVGRRARLHRSARPRRPRARQEPPRPDPPAPRRPRPAARRRRPARPTRTRSPRSCGAALDGDAVVIPFGGGIEHLRQPRGRAEARRAPVISVDMGRLNRVLAIDADVAAGARPGRRLRPRPRASSSTRSGWTIGHFPDSFTHSTLGGWIATRSSGMQSDRYGDIADLTARAARRHPVGHARHARPVPSTSTGPSVREMVLGSEGRLGVITEATVHVRRVPERAQDPRLPVPDLARRAWPRCATSPPARRRRRSRACPTPTRPRSRSPRASAPTALDRVKSKALQTFLRRRGLRPRGDVPVVHRLRGQRTSHVAAQRKLGRADRRAPRRRCASARARASSTTRRSSTRPTSATSCSTAARSADVSETVGAVERAADGLRQRRWRPAHGAFDQLGVQRLRDVPPVALLPRGRVPLLHLRVQADGRARRRSSEYDVVKSAIQQAFVDSGATLSHHHAVGTEHAPWLEQDISAPGVAMLRALFDGVDPGAQPQPGQDRRVVSHSRLGRDAADRPAPRPRRHRGRRRRGGVPGVGGRSGEHDRVAAVGAGHVLAGPLSSKRSGFEPVRW